MSAHPLTTFVYETFGQQFGDVIMAGYGEEPGGECRRLYLAKSEAGVETDWVIEMLANRLPYGDEPLVLAALLKLLLSSPNLSPHFEFEMGDLLAELRWPDGMETRRQAEAAIVGYVGLLYDKHMDERAGRRASAAASEGGCYHLLSGYVRGDKFGTGEALIKPIGVVYFDDSFIRGLKEGRVCFAGINFGPLQTTG